MGHCRKVRIEGFQADKLLSECIKEKLELRDIKIEDSLSLTLKLTEGDYKRLLRVAGKRYRITTLSEMGYAPFARKVFSQKSRIIGAVIFIFLMYYQSLFIAEIKITGYERITEATIREALKSAGLYEGSKKDLDKTDEFKTALYTYLDDLAWVGISYKGGLAEVEIVENTVRSPMVNVSTPCNIVAAKDGYISRVTPKQGMRAVEDGRFVKSGDVLIAGIVPIKSSVYSTSAAALTEKYVHAQGSVLAKVPDRFIYYQERYELVKTKTGRKLIGIYVLFGDKIIDTVKNRNEFQASICSSEEILSIVRPFPIKIAFSEMEEVTLTKKERDENIVKDMAESMIRRDIKEKLPEKAQILNKSLNFAREKNIIEVSAMIESLQEIGVEQEIIFGESKITE